VKLLISHKPLSPAEEMHLQVDHGLDVKDIDRESLVDEIYEMFCQCDNELFSTWHENNDAAIKHNQQIREKYACAIIDLFTDTEPS